MTPVSIAYLWPRRTIHKFLFLIVLLMYFSLVIYKELFLSVSIITDHVNAEMGVLAALGMSTMISLIIYCVYTLTVGCCDDMKILRAPYRVLQNGITSYCACIIIWWLSRGDLESKIWNTQWYMIFTWCIMASTRTVIIYVVLKPDDDEISK